MLVTLAIPKETLAGENRVAITPSLVAKLTARQLAVTLEKGAGEHAYYPDDSYTGVSIKSSVKELFSGADIIVKVQPPTAKEIRYFPKDSILISLLNPLQRHDLAAALVKQHITSFALELIPRITRAQAMDVLSSQAVVAGYKAVLMAANLMGRFFPMLTTAAGTIRPAKVVVVGAGVAGLQAISMARRLGAVVEAYDIRPEAREQIESLGAKMIAVAVDARGQGGYARELTQEEKLQQQELLAKHVASSDVVITTAAVPGRAAPRIITQNMVEQMRPGSVIVDIAAMAGGNCELTQADEVRLHAGVTICGPTNLASCVARDASDMFAKNIVNFLQLIVDEHGKIAIDWTDEIIKSTVVTCQGRDMRK